MSDDSDSCKHEAAIDIDIVHRGGEWGMIDDIDAVILEAARAAARHPASGLAGASAAVALAADDDVAALNAAYRGKPAPTNVLSFPTPPMPAHETGGGPEFLGDCILASGVVAREADALGIPVRHHLQHLVVHGLLHLSGHDHETDAEAAIMEAREVEILASLGIPDPYRDQPDPYKDQDELAPASAENET